MPISDHLRHCILYEFDQGTSCAEAYRRLYKAYANSCPSRRTVERHYERFRRGDRNICPGLTCSASSNLRPGSDDENELDSSVEVLQPPQETSIIAVTPKPSPSSTPVSNTSRKRKKPIQVITLDDTQTNSDTQPSSGGSAQTDSESPSVTYAKRSGNYVSNEAFELTF